MQLTDKDHAMPRFEQAIRNFLVKMQDMTRSSLSFLLGKSETQLPDKDDAVLRRVSGGDLALFEKCTREFASKMERSARSFQDFR